MILFCCFTLFQIVSCFAQSEVRVRLKLGTVVGKIEKWNYTDIMVFKGIPYAKPPVGPRRFKQSEPFDTPWDGDYIAKEFKSSCPQPGIPIPPNNTWPSPQSEDCLHVNVWTPAVSGSNPSSPKDVLLWVHGGAFFALSSSFFLYNPGYLTASQNIVVVSFNYRLGPLGLLYGGSEEAPGNMALHDQRLAFKWTVDNIEAFGGNPDSITIAGQSAGGMSVSLHLLSPLSKSFKKAIVMSGVAMNPVSVESPETSLKRAKAMAELLGCGSDNGSLSLSNTTMNCLRNAPVRKLIALQHKPEITEVGNRSLLGFQPTWNTDFLPDPPQKLLHGTGFVRDVPILFGSVPNDGFAIHLIYTGLANDHIDVPSKSAEFLMRQLYYYVSNFVPDSVSRVAADIMQFYFPNGTQTSDELAREQYYKVLSDLCFDCPASLYMERLATQNRVYQYLFDQPIGFLRLFMPFMFCDTFGPCHGDDVYYLFGFPLRLPFVSTANRNASVEYMKIIGDFVRTGTAHWPPHDGKSSTPNTYYVLNTVSGSGQKVDYKKDTCAFWKSKVYYNV